MSSRTTLRITIAALLSGAGVPAFADAPPAPDTSGWKCDACPFEKGYDADATLGAIYPEGANATFGRYTGLDQQKTYVDAAAHGSWHNDAGDYAHYELDDLGLDSRTGKVTIGQDGRYAFALSYAGQPNRIYDSTVTPFQTAGAPALPAGWVAAGTTAGMTALAANLHPVDIGTLRKSAGLEARGVLGSGITVFAKVTHETKTGTEITGAAFLVQATQLATAVDYETNTAEAGLAWASATSSARFTLSESKFKDPWTGMGFQNPYLPLVPSATYGVLALPPDNESRQASLSASTLLPGHTSVSASLAWSELKQDEALLPSSTLPDAAVPGAFDGKVDLGHYAATIGSRPLTGLNIYGRIAYDERKDKSTPLTITQVVTDVLPGVATTTPRYDYQRLRLDGGVDYRVWKWVTIGIGGDRLNVDRTNQVAGRTEDGRTYGRVKLTPTAGLAVTLKGGAAHRDAKDIDLTQLPANENPLLSIFNLSNRDRDFGQLELSWAASQTVSLGVDGLMANDRYGRSTLGLLSGRERRLGASAGWTPREALSFYADGGYQTRETMQAGQYSTSSDPWQAEIRDRYWTAAAGGRYALKQWEFKADYAHATSAGDTGVGGVGALGAYPQLRTRYDSAGLTVGYAATQALKVKLRYLYQNFVSDDWALDGIGPQTVANLLSLAAPASKYNVNLFSLSFSYRFGAPAAVSKAEE